MFVCVCRKRDSRSELVHSLVLSPNVQSTQGQAEAGNQKAYANLPGGGRNKLTTALHSLH